MCLQAEEIVTKKTGHFLFICGRSGYIDGGSRGSRAHRERPTVLRPREDVFPLTYGEAENGEFEKTPKNTSIGKDYLSMFM